MAGTTTLDTTSLRDSFIPQFDGQPQSYREWRKRIAIYHHKMTLQKRSGESLLNLIGSLQGAAWKVVEDYDLKKIEKEGAFDELMGMLDKAFAYDDRVQMPQDFENFFTHNLRKPGSTLLQFCTEFDEKLRRLQAHGVKLPTTVQGWFLLKKANVTREQRQLALTHAPGLEKNKVQEALYLFLGQDHKAAVVPERRPFGRGKGHKAFVAEEGWDDLDEAFYQEDHGWEDDYEAPTIESWQDDDFGFDQEAGYYQYDNEYEDEEEGFVATSDGPWDIDEYDSAYASYLDARKRFSDLKLSRGYLPIVALQDDTNPSSTPSSPQRPHKGKGPRKGKGGKKGRSSTIKYPSRPGGKAPDPKARSFAAIQCLRCGASGHMAANCPKKGTSTSSGPSVVNSPAKRQHTEGMAANTTPVDEHGHVIFEDLQGRQRVDCTMIDPGASAFLMGTGPFERYIQHLQELQYPVDDIQMTSIKRVFHFGGDHSVSCHWKARLLVFFNHNYGYVTGFVIPGETPMLMGRPILEALGLTLNFQKKLLVWEDSPWQDITIGRHGEYLLPLTADFQPDMLTRPPAFDLVLADSALHEDVEPFTVDFKTYKSQEGVSQDAGQTPVAEGSRKIVLKDWKRIDHALNHTERQLQATGWDFDDPSHRAAFLRKQQDELPDEILLAPKCSLWSKMQALAANTPERKEKLQEERQWHHDVHLRFVRQIYRRQVLGARHAHLEQPKEALSWYTKALQNLPGYHVVFHQCAYGACCKDIDNSWKLVLKPTALRTTKRAMAQSMNLLCDKSHTHCTLEGRMAGGRLRTKYLEDYQPAMASVLAVALAAEETPQAWNQAYTLEDSQPVRSHQGRLIQLLTTNKQEAVRVVQTLHRNLGHPSAEKLTDLLEVRGASPEVLEVARQYHCATCDMFKKPAQASPSSAKVVTTFNDQLQCDVFWIKSGQNKFPILSMIDAATKWQAATLLQAERGDCLIDALQRCWLALFGPPAQLITDEGRGWLSDEFTRFTDELALQHTVAPGEAHERLALVERRHAVLRKSCELYLRETAQEGGSAIREALIYVVPQLNAQPNASGYSPSQWLLGQQPHFPGDSSQSSFVTTSPRRLQGL